MSSAPTTSAADFSVQSLDRHRLRLRPGLEFAFRHFDRQPGYVVEDPWTGHFYRLGVPEYTFIRLLDEGRTVREALAASAAELGPRALDEHDAAVICRWLVETRLAGTDQSVSAARLEESARQERRTKRLEWANPLALRISLGSPDRLLEAIGPWLGWLVDPRAVRWGLVLATSSLLVVLVHSGAFLSTAAQVIRPHTWLTGLAVFGLLKLWHELFHALAARRFGAEVTDAGIICFLGTPLAYVDLTSTYRLSGPRQRIAVALAGVYGEALAGGAALWVWSMLSPGLLRDLAAQTVLLATVASWTVNLNPLVRFDGYFVLCEMLHLPNLAGWGQQYTSFLARRYLLGEPAEFQPPGHRRLIGLYAIASWFWRAAMSLGIVVAAASWFHGLGLLVSLAAVVWWWLMPLVRIGRSLATNPGRPRRGLRAAAMVISAAAGVTCLAMFVPWPVPTLAPATVVYEPLTTVHTQSSGFVERVLIGDGETVAADQPLIELDSDTLALELRQAELELAAAELRSRGLLHERKTAARQALAQELTVLSARVDECRRAIDQLVVRAPVAGRVLGRQLERLPGRYLENGSAICQIGSDTHKQLRVSVGQQDQPRFTQRIGHEVAAVVFGSGSPAGRLTVVDVRPQAAVDAVDPALTALAGGSLAVRATSNEVEQAGAEQAGHDGWELEEARFTAHVELPSGTAARLAAGQTAWVGFFETDESIAQHLAGQVQRWLGW